MDGEREGGRELLEFCQQHGTSSEIRTGKGRERISCWGVWGGGGQGKEREKKGVYRERGEGDGERGRLEYDIIFSHT